MSVSISDVSMVSDTSTTATYGGQDLDQEAFLNLLIAQLQNQDPMEPQDSHEFVAELAQFSSLEELMTVNDGLETLYFATSSMNNATMTQLIGKEVVAYGDEFTYDGDGEVDLYYNASSETSQTTLNIYDEDDNLIYSDELGALSEGEGQYSWDGSTIDGSTAGEGSYRFELEATDTNGDDVSVSTMIHGVVDTMNYETGSPIPEIDGIQVELGNIIRVEESSSDTASEQETDQDDELV